MEIDINQRETGYQYQIYSQGQQIRVIQEYILPHKINLYSMDGRKVILTARKRWSFWRIKYDIQYADGRNVHLQSLSVWKNHFRARKGLKVYDIYRHQGRKYSIDENNRQIAWWDKEMVSFLGKDNYKIFADDDCDLDLVITFCLITDKANSEDNAKTVSFDLGYLGPTAKEFNPSWQPNTTNKFS